MNWLKKRRKELNFTQEDIAARLQLSGFQYTAGSISHWETERHSPPLDDPKFSSAMAEVLQISVGTLLTLAGYDVSRKTYSEAAERAAWIIDQLPPDKQQLALKLVEQLQN